MAYNSKFTGAQIDALLDASGAMQTSKEDVANKVTSINADADDVHYPSAKAVKEAIESDITKLDLQVEKTVVSTNQFRNGGSGNGSNAYKVRTCGIDVRGKGKIIFTTDRPLSGNSHYMYECFFVKEATAIGQFFASNENPNGFTKAGTQSGIAQNEIVVIPSEASAVVVGICEIPNDGKEGDIVLRVTDFMGYRVGYSVNIANSEMPSIYQAITDINSKNQEQDAELEKLITKTNTFVTTNSLRNGGSGNGSNAYKVRTCGIDVRGKSAIIFYTNRPLSGNSHYVYECIFAKEESAIGQFFASNENPNGFTLKAYAGIGQDDMLYIPENFSAVVIAIYEIPNDGKEGDIGLRVDSFSGYEIGYNYYAVEKELSATKDRVSALEVGVSKLEDRVSELEDGGAYTRNIRKIIPLGAACRQRKSSNTSKDFQIIEVTDSHADTQAVLNAVNMANGFKTVDAIVHCGDMAGDYITPATTMSAYINAMKNSIKPWYNVIGNHEAGTYNMVGYVPSIQHMYNELIAPIVDAGYLTDGEYQVGKCHYYHDFAEYNIRLICVNEYDGDLAFDTEYWHAVAYDSSASAFAWGTQYNVGDIIKMPNYTEFCFKCVKTAITGSSIYGLSGQEPRYKERPGSRMISQEQAQWFINTLMSTPEGYSIIIAMHNPFSENAVVDIAKKFSEKVNVVSSAAAQNSMENDFFADVVDAYVNGAAYSAYIAFKGNASYRNTLTNSEGKAYAYHLSADFSGKNSNTRFMCYIGGHVHRDCVWNHSTYNNQWQVTPVCATTGYHQSPTSDIRRSSVDGLDYDSITSISFNTSNRAISLVKIGVDVTENMENRDFEKIVL